MTTDELSPPVTTDASAPPKRSLLEQLWLDSAYLLTGPPLAVVSFTIMVTGLSLGLSLLITLVGIPLLVLVLQLGRMLAVLERWRVERVSGVKLTAIYRPSAANASWLRSWWDRLRDTQAWLDLTHGIVVFPLTILTWSIAVTWYCLALSGLTHWVWGRTLPDNGSSQDLSDFVDLPWPEWVSWLLVGMVFTLTLPVVLRLCAGAQTALASALLGNSQIARLQQRIAVLTESRSAGAKAEIDSLRRLERDLHDGPQQRLVRLGMDLAAIQRRLAHDDGAAAAELVEDASAQTAEALTELRALTRGIAPPILIDRGLAAALDALANRSGVSTTLRVLLPARYAAPIETAAYYVVSEALTNVAKHSQATTVAIRAWVDDAQLNVEVIDDGVGGAAFDKGRGLAGLADRVAALDGRLTLHSPDTGTTTVRAVIPCG